MKIEAVIEKGRDGRYGIYMKNEDLDYLCTGEGASVEAAKADFMRAYEEIATHYAKVGKDFRRGDIEFIYDVPSFLQDFANVFTLAGLSRLTGVNQKQLGHYISGYRHPSAATARKIEEGVKGFCDRLSKVKFA